MTADQFKNRFPAEVTDRIFSADRTDRFFDALYGDAQEGAYDIRLVFSGNSADKLYFEFQLNQRPDKCLACHLTYGLPKVFARHPVIDISSVVKAIERHLGGYYRCRGWELGNTLEVSTTRHVIPLMISLSLRDTPPA
jgi:hypothetical protein